MKKPVFKIDRFVFKSRAELCKSCDRSLRNAAAPMVPGVRSQIESPWLTHDNKTEEQLAFLYYDMIDAIIKNSFTAPA